MAQAKANHEKRLARGRRIRQLIASERRALRRGDIHIEEALRNPSDALKRLPIYIALREAPKLGEKSAQKLCERFDVWPLEPLGKMAPREREEIADALPERVRAF